MLPPGYHEHKIIEAAETRHRERDLGHVRALEDRDRRDGLISRLVGWLASLRPGSSERAAPAAEEHELTDYVCRLDDGSMGRVAIRESDGEWVAVCVRAA